MKVISKIVMSEEAFAEAFKDPLLICADCGFSIDEYWNSFLRSGPYIITHNPADFTVTLERYMENSMMIDMADKEINRTIDRKVDDARRICNRKIDGIEERLIVIEKKEVSREKTKKFIGKFIWYTILFILATVGFLCIINQLAIAGGLG